MFQIDIFLWSFSGSFLYIFWVFSEPCQAIATWSGKNRRFAKQSNAKLGRFIGCWTSSISTSASTWIRGPHSRRHWTQPRAVWIQIMVSNWAELSAGSSASCLGRKKPRRSRWFEAQPSRVARPSWRTVNSMPMRWPLEGIKPCSWWGTL